jgi:hypothetical protein
MQPLWNETLAKLNLTGPFHAVLAKDAFVILLSNHKDGANFEVFIGDRIFDSATEVLSNMLIKFRKSDGTIVGGRFDNFPNIRESHLSFINCDFEMEDAEWARPYASAIVIGLNSEYAKSPEKRAIELFSLHHIRQNFYDWDEISKLLGARGESGDIINAAKTLANQFENLLQEAEREEQLQVFLKQNPFFIYPEYIKVYPKLSLAGYKDTDFVFANAGSSGLEHVFVEIERANKKIFTKEGDFHHEYTQAKGQINKWKVWILKNFAYLKSEIIHDILDPTYHLIMGRSTELDEKRRMEINVDLSPTGVRFSTYDDILSKFRQVITRLEEMGNVDRQ